MGMKLCASYGCTQTFETAGARKFCDDHKPVKASGKRGKKKQLAAKPAKVEEQMVVPIDVSEAQLDRIWSGCTIEEKGLAVQTILDCQRNEAEA